VALLVDVWLFMVVPTVFALTKSVLPISQGAAHHQQQRQLYSPHVHLLAGKIASPAAAAAA
jgi:hypothetical protein